MTLLFPDLAEQLAGARERQVAAQATTRRRRNRRLSFGLGTSMVLAGVVAALMFLSPLKSAPGLLSPEQAVAAVAADLQTDGVLHWRDIQGPAAMFGDADVSKHGGTIIDRWIDLRTGASRTVQTMSYQGPRWDPGLRTSVVKIWSDGTSMWTQGDHKPDSVGKTVIEHNIYRKPGTSILVGSDPVSKVRKLLKRAAEGKVMVTNGGELKGVPVVKITDRRPALTMETWLTKDASPRIVKAVYTMPMPCPAKLGCRPETKKQVDRNTTMTQIWDVHPRSADALAEVAVPKFPVGQYRVITKNTIAARHHG